MADSVPLHHGKFLDFFVQDGWEYVSRTRDVQVVAIVALSSEEELILVEQYRVPVGHRVVELPAGLVGDEESSEKESSLQAAKRELLEETGYVSEDWRHAFLGCSSAGLSDERITVFVARDVRKEGPGGGVDDEQIDVLKVPIPELKEFLRSREADNVLVDLKIWFASEAIRLSE